MSDVPECLLENLFLTSPTSLISQTCPSRSAASKNLPEFSSRKRQRRSVSQSFSTEILFPDFISFRCKSSPRLLCLSASPRPIPRFPAEYLSFPSVPLAFLISANTESRCGPFPLNKRLGRFTDDSRLKRGGIPGSRSRLRELIKSNGTAEVSEIRKSTIDRDWLERRD